MVSQGDTPKTEKKSAAAELVELGIDLFDFRLDTNGKAYGIRKRGHVAVPVSGSKVSVRQQLAGLYRRATGRTASQNALAEAVSALEFEADEAGDPVELHLRTARLGDNVYIDLGDKAEHVVRVNASGWEVLDGTVPVPVLFRRTNVTAPLPIPAQGGDLDRLWAFVNVPSEDDRLLIKGWLTSACVLVGLPVPILALLGEQGTAKTSSAKRIFSLFDPSTAAVRRPPSDADRLLHAGAHSRSVIFDNLSSIPRWLSDGLCRFVTGEGDVDRALYTDDDARIIRLQGVLGFTGIDVGSLAGDLAERCVWGELGVIPASERRSERDLNADWDEAYPSMVGGLLDLIVVALQNLSQVELNERPRMADFAEVLAALDLAGDGRSLEHYMRAQASVAEEIVDTDRFLVTLAEKVTSRWEGTGKELHALLPRPDGDKYWPEQRGISGKLRRSAPDLRKAGWSVEEVKSDPASKRPKTWVLVPPAAGLSDEDVNRVQLARQLRDLDIEEWRDRILHDGGRPDCVDTHLRHHRAGVRYTCADCSAAVWKPEYVLMAERSKAADAALLKALEVLGTDLIEFDRRVADRDALNATVSDMKRTAMKKWAESGAAA